MERTRQYFSALRAGLKTSEETSYALQRELESVLAQRDRAVEALRDAATVIERMANGASRAECSPEFDRLVAVLSGQEKKQPAS